MNIWAITIPKAVHWCDYQEEIKAATDWSVMLNFRVHRTPRLMTSRDLMFVINDGLVRGCHIIIDVVERERWTCETTGVEWRAGHYIQRSGPFFSIEGERIKMRGFRGVRLWADDGSMVPRDFVRSVRDVLAILRRARDDQQRST